MKDFTRRRGWLLPVLLVAASASAMVLSRACLGFQFPVPWPDETGFVSPAFNLAFTGSLFDAGINPDRIVMWMPPGYMVLLAVFFRVFGYSFALVRWVSAGFVLLSLGFSASVAWRMCAGWRQTAAVAVVAAAFASPSMLLSGNIGRMESLFCCLMLAALSAGGAGRLYVMAALIGLGGLVHPNAVYFGPIAVAAFVARAWLGTLVPPGRGGWMALGICVLAWLGYAVLIAANWHGFLTDMHAQFAGRQWSGGNSEHPQWILVCAVLLLLWCAATVRQFDARMLTASFGAAFVAMASVGREIWYDYGYALGFALLAVGCLAGPAAVEWQKSLRFPAALAAALGLFCCVRITPTMASLLPSRAMLTRNVVPAADIAKVGQFIAGLRPGQTVDFGWTGMECFFLADLRHAGARWTIIRHSVTQIYPFRGSDWRVACDSDEFPKVLFLYDVSFTRHGLISGCNILPGARVGKK